MPREPDFDEGLHPEGPSASDLDRFGDEFTRCPACKRRFYDQSDICPHCGHALGDAPAGVPVWAIVTAVVIVVAIVWFYL